MEIKGEDGKIIKVDGRKFNKGRHGNKQNQQDSSMAEEIKNTETTTTNDQSQDKNQQDIINEMANSGINPHPKPDTPPKLNTDKIEEAKLIDPEKLSDAIENTDFTPLNTKVKEEDYRNPVRGLEDFQPNTPINEPVFKKPDMSTINGAMNTAPVNPTSTPSPKIDGTPMAERSGLGEALANPDMKFGTPEEKKQGAEQLVDGMLDAYGLLKQGIAWAASINVDKLVEKEIDGKIDLQLPIPINPEGDTVTLKAFVENYNQEAKKALIVSDDFIQKVRPVMIRICEKNGWGLTDEQYVIYLVGRDLAESIAIAVAMNRGMTQALSILEKTHLRTQNEQREEATNTPKPKQPPTSSHQQPVEDSSNINNGNVEEAHIIKNSTDSEDNLKSLAINMSGSNDDDLKSQ